MKNLLNALLIAVAGITNAHSAEIDPFLSRLADTHAARGIDAALMEARSRSINVRMTDQGPLFPVILHADDTETATTENTAIFTAVGARVDARSQSLIRVLVPINNINRLASLRGVSKVRLPYPLTEVHGYGTNVNESVNLTGAEDYHQLNNIGSGVRVAVVDLGFSQLTSAKTAGEIPSNVITYDFTGTGLESGTQHGTGVAEHIIDMAPGAQLYLLKVGDEVDLQNAATYIRNNNIRVANLSVAWMVSSYYDDTGIINTTINNSRDTDGVFWAVASGNFAQKHWRGTWSDSNGNARLEYTGTDEALALQGSSSTISVFLNWNQYGVSNKANLDLYLLSSTGAVVQSSTINNRFTDPVEAITYTYNSSEAPYSLQVRLSSGSASGLDITLFSFNHNFEYQVAASSVADPASAHGAFTVAAIHRNNWTLADPPVEPYSSQGPTNDGRLKPNIAAPDCTRSRTYGANSCGTSFASPTIAGSAALILSANPTFTAADIENELMTNTIPPLNPVGSGPI